MSERFNSYNMEGADSSIIELGQTLESRFEQAELRRIKIESFKGFGIFSDEEIDRDVKYVLDRTNSFKLSAQKMTGTERRIHDEAKIIETLLPYIIHDYKWLGDVEMLYASTYDDLHNGFDAIAQIKGLNGENFGFEIDFTSSLQEMMNKIKKGEEIMKVKGPSVVKYYDSSKTGKIGNVQMPRIAFGDSRLVLSEFSAIVAEAYTDPKNEKAREELRRHKIRSHFVESVKFQLNANGKIAKSLGFTEYSKQHAVILKHIMDNKF